MTCRGPRRSRSSPARIVLVDNTARINELLKLWNDSRGWPPTPGTGGAGGSSGTGGATSGGTGGFGGSTSGGTGGFGGAGGVGGVGGAGRGGIGGSGGATGGAAAAVLDRQAAREELAPSTVAAARAVLERPAARAASLRVEVRTEPSMVRAAGAAARFTSGHRRSLLSPWSAAESFCGERAGADRQHFDDGLAVRI